MSDQIKHECGLALVRLLKPLDYYYTRYGTAFYGLQKLHLLMQKQRNRGQDGAGLATIKLNVPPGHKYISRRRSNAPNYLSALFEGVMSHFKDLTDEQINNAQWLKSHKPFMGEVLLGHLRYGTHGDNTLETVHPFIRENNWISRNLILAGNFNMTNVNELFEKLVSLGQHPKLKSDSITILERLGHFLDEEVQYLVNWYKPESRDQKELNELIFNNLDLAGVLQKAAKKFDGGYTIAGMLGFGDAFVLRDPNGIRPAFYYHDEEIVAVASERPALQTAFGLDSKQIKEIGPGNALIIKHHGLVMEAPVMEPGKKSSCSFERIYFSRGNDCDIYQERKNLGRELVPAVLKSIDFDFENTVFSFIPNTSEVAFLGFAETLQDVHNDRKWKQVLQSDFKARQMMEISKTKPRIEKLVVKDDKMRTFIADHKVRGSLVAHIYDVTYGVVRPHKDNLVVLDDSIVRGTTLRDSIVQILSTLKPKKIILVSSAPQIRYPDCYGIDMSQMGQFVAFKALVELLHDHNKEYLLEETYEKCLAQKDLESNRMVNHLIELYAAFSYEEISQKIAELITPKDCRIPVEVIFQTLEGLHKACPNHSGDWYFSGIYPTPGGNRVVNNAFINYMQKRDVRAY